LYWITGKNINEFILHNMRATYGKPIVYAVRRQLMWTAFLLNPKDIKVAQYLTKLPEKQWFIDKLNRSIEIAKQYKKEKYE